MPNETAPSFTPTLTPGSAYAAGNCVGGIQTVTVPPSRPILQSLVLSDAAAQASALEFLFFNSAPAGGTYTNKVALALSAADQAKLIGKLTVAAADWSTVGGFSTLSKAAGAQPMSGVGTSGTLYVLIAIGTGSTPTWTGAGNLVINPGFVQG